MILLMMPLSCTLKVKETVGVLWRRYGLSLKVVKLWWCFKIEEVRNVAQNLSTFWAKSKEKLKSFNFAMVMRTREYFYCQCIAEVTDCKIVD